jgi:hypothetical protein
MRLAWSLKNHNRKEPTMKRYGTPAALLSLLLAVGCGDRGDTNAQNADGNTPAATEAAPDASAPAADTRARSDEPTDGARATAGPRPSRPAASARPSTRGNAARPTESERESSAPAERDTRASNAAPAPRVEWREITVPAGTALPLELETALSSETAQIETPVRAKLKQAVAVNGVTALPAGAVLVGDVTEVERAGRVKGRSKLVFSFNRLQADNLTGDLRTEPVSFVGEATKGEDATKVGAGAGIGAVIGGIVGGKGGAAKGAAIGGGAGTGVVLATRGKEVELASGADIATTLAAPFTVRVPVR